MWFDSMYDFIHFSIANNENGTKIDIISPFSEENFQIQEGTDGYKRTPKIWVSSMHNFIHFLMVQ